MRRAARVARTERHRREQAAIMQLKPSLGRRRRRRRRVGRGCADVGHCCGCGRRLQARVERAHARGGVLGVRARDGGEALGVPRQLELGGTPGRHARAALAHDLGRVVRPLAHAPLQLGGRHVQHERVRGRATRARDLHEVRALRRVEVHPVDHHAAALLERRTRRTLDLLSRAGLAVADGVLADVHPRRRRAEQRRAEERLACPLRPAQHEQQRVARIPAQQRQPALQHGRGRRLHCGGGAKRVRRGGRAATGRAEGLLGRAEGECPAALRADVGRKVAVGAAEVGLPPRRVADEERAREVDRFAAVEHLLHATGGCNLTPERLQPYAHAQGRRLPYGAAAQRLLHGGPHAGRGLAVLVVARGEEAVQRHAAAQREPVDQRPHARGGLALAILGARDGALDHALVGQDDDLEPVRVHALKHRGHLAAPQRVVGQLVGPPLPIQRPAQQRAVHIEAGGAAARWLVRAAHQQRVTAGGPRRVARRRHLARHEVLVASRRRHRRGGGGGGGGG